MVISIDKQQSLTIYCGFLIFGMLNKFKKIMVLESCIVCEGWSVQN